MNNSHGASLAFIESAVGDYLILGVAA